MTRFNIINILLFRLQSLDYNIIVKYRTRQIKATITFKKSFDFSCSILDKDIFSH